MPRLVPAPEPSALVPEPSAPAESELQALPCLEPRAAAAPEKPAPAEPAMSTSRVGQVAAARAAPTWQPSRTPSASTEMAHRGPSARPSSSQAAEPLPDVLGSAREVIKRLEAAVAMKRGELERDRTTLIEERGRLEEVGQLLEGRIASARATHERAMCTVAEEREALEEASCLEQASRRRAVELLARERLVRAWEEAIGQREKSVETAQADLARRNDEIKRGRTEVHHREEEIAIRETDIEITATVQDARKE